MISKVTKIYGYMQENNNKYCPNMLFNANNITIGEFKTLEDAMNFPLKECWCVNKSEGNLFEQYKSQGYRILIIHLMNRTDAWKFVVAIVGHRQVKYWDTNDIPIEIEKNKYELTIGEDAENVIYDILHKQSQQIIQENKQYRNTNTIMKQKQTIKLNESQLRRMIKESVKNVLKENDINNTTSLKDELFNMIKSCAIKTVGIECVDTNDDDTIVVYSPSNNGEYININIGYGYNGINESTLHRTVKKSIKSILRESVEDEAWNFVQSVNLDELIQNGETYTEYGEGFYISRSSNRRGAMLELTITGDNGYGHARVGLAGDLEEDYQYALSLAYEDYLASNQPS